MTQTAIRAFIFIGLICTVGARASWAQVQNASLTGLVLDPSGAVAPRASVTVRNSATNLTYRQETDSSGYYFFQSLPIGGYTLSVEMRGFKAIRTEIVLEVGQRRRNDFTLEIGGVTEVIAVEAASSSLETQQAAPSTVVQNRIVIDIPLSARNWDDLLQTVPGVAGDRYTEQGGSTAAGRTGGANVHGVRSLQNNFLLDGVDNNTISENVQELSTQTVHTSVDAIQEFKVTTAPYSPEYGRSPGAAITVATKSGSNQFRGALWEFLRNDKFDAADFFLNRAGVRKAKNRQNQFGGNAGGPIIGDRAFFFFNYEGARIVRGQTRLTNVPTASERIGDFSAQAAAANGTTYANIFDNVGDCIQKAPGAFSASDPFGPTHSVITGYLPRAWIPWHRRSFLFCRSRILCREAALVIQITICGCPRSRTTTILIRFEETRTSQQINTSSRDTYTPTASGLCLEHSEASSTGPGRPPSDGRT